jgi:hypothetical protein
MGRAADAAGEKPDGGRPPSWRGWLVAIAVAAILSALTTLALECLFRHGPAGAGCLSGMCGGGCRPAERGAAHPGAGHGGEVVEPTTERSKR